MTNLLTVTRSSPLRYSVSLLAIAAALLFLWPGLSKNLFAIGADARLFMPHGLCFLWVPGYSTEIVQDQFDEKSQFLEQLSSALLQKPYNFETFGRKVREVLDQAKR
jgi:hypothetical protein